MTVELPRAVEHVAGAFFEAASAARGKRIFHPVGVGYRGSLELRSADEAEMLGLRNRRHRTLVRFSRGIGLPEPLPDVLGLALRISAAHGPRRPQDFLLVTSVAGPGLQHLIAPAPRGFLGHSYSSVLPYRIDGRVRLVAARPQPLSAGVLTLAQLRARVERGQVAFVLGLTTLGGGWEEIGSLTLGSRLAPAEAERLRFNPSNAGGSVRPVGLVNALRPAAYSGSQRGRPR